MLPKPPRVPWVAVLVCALAAVPALAQPVGTAFTYQGRLTDNDSPANGPYDLRFTLHDAASAGNQVGSPITLSSVAVANGLFAVSLDFGSSAFAGSRRWLEVGARPGGSAGAFTTLSPRQELTPAPQALRAADAASATTVAGLSCADGQVVKWSGTGWTCGDDIDTNSGGTVTSVATGAGLTGGPISGSGTVSIATGGVSSSMIANGAVGAAQINPAQVQARVTGTCTAWEYIRGINADGSIACEPLPLTPITAVDDLANDVGYFTSIAIGSDGLPVISYYDQTAVALKVAKCANAACTGASTITTVDDPASGAGSFTSIAIGADGLPVVSYHDMGGQALKVAKCANAACTGASTVTTVDDPANSVGYDTAMAIGADARPVISYYDATARALKVAHCGNGACSSGNSKWTVDDPANDVGLYTSIAIGTDGLPVISYYDATAGALKVAQCGDAACSTGNPNTITTVDDAGDVGRDTSIAIGADGLPVVSYYDVGGWALKVAKCANAACTGASTITTVDDPGHAVGSHTSIAIGTDGLPVISYFDATAGALKVAKCLNAACTGIASIVTVDSGAVGWYTSIAIGTDGLPVISYYDQTDRALRVAKCRTPSCR